MSQNSSTGEAAIRIGDRLRVRRQRWLVTGVTRHDDGAVLTLSGVGSANLGHQQTFLTPFDRVEPLRNRRRLRRTSRRHWRASCRALIVRDGSADALHTAESARMDLLPHQLEPALAVVRGVGSRLLIADEVGLGKTVQAALIVAELRARGAATRVLVLTPAGLRDQWVAEFSDRFDLPLRLFDLRAVREHRARWPIGVSPWTTNPMIVASLDYVKRPEVLAAVASDAWDVVVVDEAHHATAGTDRFDAVSTICSRAAYTILLTATPHSGDGSAFDSLHRIGQQDDELIVFRRTRDEIGHQRRRRVHQLNVGLTSAERLMHTRLAAFIRAARADHRNHDISVALGVLRKRAFSSAFALERTVRRRLLALDSANGDDVHRQLDLPLDDATGEQDVEDAAPAWTIPALLDRQRERLLLTRVADAASTASVAETKLRVLRRLLRRLREPAIVFTEYRDTLMHVRDCVVPDAAVIHGGLSRGERRDALRAFEQGRVLLTTDAAGEGLNLQHTCRVVINLELPWNPMRLEQRIGRVDRIGQPRTVHAFHLIAAATGERRVLQHLVARLSAARESVGAADPLGGSDTPVSAPSISGVRLISAADAEHQRLNQARRFVAANSVSVGDHGVLMARAKHWATRRALKGRMLLVVRSEAADVFGRAIASRLEGLLLPLDPQLKAIPAALDRLAAEHVGTAHVRWADDVEAAHHAFWTTRLNRETAIARRLDVTAVASLQPGLFDQRAMLEHTQDIDRRTAAHLQQLQRINLAERAREIAFSPPRSLLLLLP